MMRASRLGAVRRPGGGSRVGARLVLVTVLIGLLQLLWVGPASAHADFIGSDPANGARLDQPPPQVTLSFTEDVNLIEGGLRLLDADGSEVQTGDAIADGSTVVWKMPADLPTGAYVASWRVISADGHPIAGALSFGIGTAAAGVDASTAEATAPWPVVGSRYAGYLGYALVAGALMFVLFCAPHAGADGRVQWLSRTGIVLGAVATAVGVLVQGTYVSGAGLSRMWDLALVQQTLETPFGLWSAWRLALYGALAVLTWRLAWLDSATTRWAAALPIVAIAVTFSNTGHAAAGGVFDKAVDSVHAAAAGIWVGGLAVLTVLGRSTESRVVHRFSQIALTSVLVLVATGVVNSWVRLTALDELWRTRYGQVLLLKSLLVVGAIAAASISRRVHGRGDSPWQSVRTEAAIVVVVLAVTSVLTLTSPPLQPGAATAASGPTAAPRSTTLRLDLGDRRTAELHVEPLVTGGSGFHLSLFDDNGALMEVNRVELKASLPEAELVSMPVPLNEAGGTWTGNFDFPLPGSWSLTLTVEDKDLTAVVATGQVTITR